MALNKRESSLSEAIDEALAHLQDMADLLSNIDNETDKETLLELRADLLDLILNATPAMESVSEGMKPFE